MSNVQLFWLRAFDKSLNFNRGHRVSFWSVLTKTRVISVHRQRSRCSSTHGTLMLLSSIVLKYYMYIQTYRAVVSFTKIYIRMSKNLNLQRALSLNLVPDIFLGLVDKNGNCHVNRYAACVDICVHWSLSMRWKNLYQAFHFPPHFYLSALGMKRAGRYFRKLTRTLE